jgi:hypothetical protein
MPASIGRPSGSICVDRSSNLIKQSDQSAYRHPPRVASSSLVVLKTLMNHLETLHLSMTVPVVVESL